MRKEAILYKSLKNNNLMCTCCNHFCSIKNQETGKCGIRQNIDGKLYLLTHSQALGVNIDPIEKKPLYHFLPDSKVFSLGTAGCNFTCDFCQNFSMSQAKGLNLSYIENSGMYLPPEKIVEYAKEYNIPSIAFTYNEPTVFFEYTYDTMKLAKQEGIKTIYVSNGYESPQLLDLAKDYLDAINIDLKGFKESFYKDLCNGKLDPILKNIKYISQETDIWLEVTTLIIPGENDTQEDFEQIADFIKDINPSIPWHISAFHPDYKMDSTPSTSFDTLEKAYQIGKEKGIKHIYIGNIPNENYQNTYCPNCESLLIKRNPLVQENNLQIEMTNKAKCFNCEKKIQGIFK